MKKLFYRALIWVSRILGLWVFRLFASIVSTGYFCLFPRRVATCVRFYGALFPNRGRRYHPFLFKFDIWIMLQYIKNSVCFSKKFLATKYDTRRDKN
jgi:hypothetical protein